MSIRDGRPNRKGLGEIKWWEMSENILVLMKRQVERSKQFTCSSLGAPLEKGKHGDY
jgi:hypothetical protein